MQGNGPQHVDFMDKSSTKPSKGNNTLNLIQNKDTT